MEETLVKFISHNYRTLLQSKLQVLNDLDLLLQEQNKDVLQKLQDENLADKNGVPMGFNLKATSKKDIENNQNIIKNYTSKYYEYGGKEEILIDINELINKLTITNIDITKCLIP